ncbi:hypothetical protein HMPREF9413_2518 [Paenibacillus sp. HGF7]|nr:hypothetical protein HMPREF9413_2518 [Paenibacillus sp. HGF7]
MDAGKNQVKRGIIHNRSSGTGLEYEKKQGNLRSRGFPFDY